jgi:hypothetical protein
VANVIPQKKPATKLQVRRSFLFATADPTDPHTAATMATAKSKNIKFVGSSEPMRNLQAVVGGPLARSNHPCCPTEVVAHRS